MLVSLRQLQEKCHEQQVPSFIAFKDLTNASFFIVEAAFFKLLENSVPPNV